MGGVGGVDIIVLLHQVSYAYTHKHTTMGVLNYSYVCMKYQISVFNWVRFTANTFKRVVIIIISSSSSSSSSTSSSSSSSSSSSGSSSTSSSSRERKLMYL